MLELVKGENHDSYSILENVALLQSFIDNKHAKKAAINDFKDLGYEQINDPFYVMVNLKLYKAQELKGNNGYEVVMLKDEKNSSLLFMDRQEFLPIIFQNRNVKDPVVAIWKEYQNVEKAYTVIEESGFEYVKQMSEEDKMKHYEANPSLKNSIHKTFEEREIAKISMLIEHKFLSTPATTKEGLTMQVKYQLESYVGVQNDVGVVRFMKVFEEGLEFL